MRYFADTTSCTDSLSLVAVGGGSFCFATHSGYGRTVFVKPGGQRGSEGRGGEGEEGEEGGRGREREGEGGRGEGGREREGEGERERGGGGVLTTMMISIILATAIPRILARLLITLILVITEGTQNHKRIIVEILR